MNEGPLYVTQVVPTTYLFLLGVPTCFRLCSTHTNILVFRTLTSSLLSYIPSLSYIVGSECTQMSCETRGHKVTIATRGNMATALQIAAQYPEALRVLRVRKKNVVRRNTSTATNKQKKNSNYWLKCTLHGNTCCNMLVGLHWWGHADSIRSPTKCNP